MYQKTHSYYLQNDCNVTAVEILRISSQAVWQFFIYNCNSHYATSVRNASPWNLFQLKG